MKIWLLNCLYWFYLQCGVVWYFHNAANIAIKIRSGAENVIYFLHHLDIGEFYGLKILLKKCAGQGLAVCRRAAYNITVIFYPVVFEGFEPFEKCCFVIFTSLFYT